jgi:carboxypeptidase family protein/TonB-dependent receptor-like protein
MRLQTSVSVRFVTLSLAILLLLGGFSATAFAQGGTGTITGTVLDPKGLSVPDAKVSILNTDTGIDRSLATTEAGFYTATFLQPGHYQVSVSKDGFSTWVRKDLLLQVGQTLAVDAPLTVGTTVSEVTVTGEAPIIEPDRTDVSQTVSETLAGGLPLNGRRWESFVFLTPGVTFDGGNGLSSYHGISSLYNNSQVDGVSNQQAFYSEDRGRTAVQYTYSLDAVKEFSVNSDNYSAEFGQAAGGEVNAVTKSGSNGLHGDLFYYLRYPALNSLDPYLRTHGSTPINGVCGQGTFLNTSIVGTPKCIAQGEHQRQQFGGSVGGPIIKDKLFYFLNYDGQRRSFPIFYTGPPTQNGANAMTNFGANNCGSNTALNPVHITATGATPVTIVGLNAAQCAAALAFINGTSGPAPRNGAQDIGLGKLDYQATTNNHFSVSFNWMNWHAADDYNTSPTQGGGSALQNGSFVTHDRYLVADWNRVVSPTIVNDFRFQWSRDFQVTSANFSGPSVTIGASTSSDIIAYGMPNALPRAEWPDEHRLEFADTASYVHGNHALKFGVDISPIHELLVNLFNGGGIYNYNYSDSNAAATLEAWIADLYNLPLSSDATTGVLVGKHYNAFFQSADTVNTTANQGKDDFYDVDYGFFAQDAWKVSPKLTLNLGLRYDLQRVPQPPDPNPNPLASIYTSHIYLDKTNIGPRLGVAYQPAKNLVVRAGFGIFFGKTTNSTYYNTRVENGQVQQQSECDAAYVPSTGAIASNASPSCDPIFPNVFFPVPGPALQAPPVPNGAALGVKTPAVTAPAAPPVLSLRGQTPTFLQPMIYESELGFEYQLPGNISASATYIFNRGAHLPACNDVNLAPSTSTVTYTINPGPISNGRTLPAGTVTIPLYTTRLNTSVKIVNACESIVHTLYNAGIFTVKKRFGHGFELLANYTVSRSMDDGETQGAFGTFGGNSSDVSLDPYNQNAEWARSDYDQPQRFVASFLYAPTFKIGSPVLSYLANGFGFSGIVTIASAFPVTAFINSSSSSHGGIDGGVTGGVSNNANAAAGRSPNYPRNYFRGPTQERNVDFRMSRDLKIWQEKYKLQLIAEAFNLFNHTIVTNVNATGYNINATALTLTPSASFLLPTATSNSVVGARQMQFSAKLFF